MKAQQQENRDIIRHNKSAGHLIRLNNTQKNNKFGSGMKCLAQMLRKLRKIRCVPRRAHVSIQPMTSGTPRDFKNAGSVIGTVSNAPIAIGIVLVAITIMQT